MYENAGLFFDLNCSKHPGMRIIDGLCSICNLKCRLQPCTNTAVSDWSFSSQHTVLFSVRYEHNIMQILFSVQRVSIICTSSDIIIARSNGGTKKKYPCIFGRVRKVLINYEQLHSVAYSLVGMEC